ncbi:transglutaminase domain-containing protein, partial [Candidatus Woesearchaeota archaeon]|nr:transglutaminase domain-containing protein [Candidatus Woesearchaeota archaeon]
EMTSLFVAMCRSLGIPAKFVSGISYTENKQVLAALGKNWAGHGWAEVYFPTIGWVSFDIAFDEYGYIDVTHIKLRESLDPDDPATKFEWLANNVNLTTEKLELDVDVLQQGQFVPEEIQLEQEILSKSVSFGSYNLVKGILKNTANHYTATTLSLAAPQEVEIIGRNKRTVLLAPREVRETYWIINVAEKLEQDYWYTFPMVMYSEKNISVNDEFIAKTGESMYSLQEIEDLTVVDERKSYSRKVFFDCNYPREVKPKEQNVFSCTIQNIGSENLKNTHYCLDDSCEVIDLNAGDQKEQKITISEEKIGWHHLIVSAENELIEKKSALSFVVLDEPDIDILVDVPKIVPFGKDILMGLTIKKSSFSTPKRLVLTLNGLGIEQRWEIDELLNEQELEITIPGSRLMKNNVLIINAVWQGQAESFSQEINIQGTSGSFIESLNMFLNRILAFFEG